jgi:hypothetical protein
MMERSVGTIGVSAQGDLGRAMTVQFNDAGSKARELAIS